MIKQVIKFPKIKILLTLFTLDDSIVNGEHRFIEFRENEMIWGNGLVTFNSPYDGSMDLDNMGPAGFHYGYNVRFLTNEIKVEGPVFYHHFNFENDMINQGEIRKELFFINLTV
jgi:hypothetical protein